MNVLASILFPFTAIVGLCGPIAAQPVVRTMLRLPDTHQTTGFTNTFGEDADFTINAPYYQVNGDGTVTDTITGLMWQQADGGEMTVASAAHYVDTLTLAGYTDWRLPGAHEAFSIMDLSANNPAIDLSAFAPTEAEYWWTSDRQANDTNKVWVTNAGGGIGNHAQSETISAGGVKRFHVRAVRDLSSQEVLPSQFEQLSPGTAMDVLTGLTWQRGHCPDTLSWEDALIYADTLTLAGYTDWRLPNVKELRSISNVELVGPSLDGGVFGNEGPRKYWSSTTLQSQPVKGWYMNTQFGITTYDQKVRRHDVRCVRGGTDLMTGIPLVGVRSDGAGLSVTPGVTAGRIAIRFTTDAGRVDLLLLNAMGQPVRRILSSAMATGSHMMEVDLTDIASGRYYIRSEQGGRTTSVPLVIVR